MIESIELNSVNIPYGVLHDQKLKNIEIINNTITFTFEIELYQNDYPKEIYNKYKAYKHCKMDVELLDNDDISCYLYYCIDKKGKFSGVEIQLDELQEFLDASNYMQFLTCMTNGCSFLMQFSIGFFDGKGKFKKFKHYSSLDLTVQAKNVSWKWY